MVAALEEALPTAIEQVLPGTHSIQTNLDPCSLTVVEPCTRNPEPCTLNPEPQTPDPQPFTLNPLPGGGAGSAGGQGGGGRPAQDRVAPIGQSRPRLLLARRVICTGHVFYIS